MEMRLYFQMLRRGWWIVLLTTLVALVVALIASYLATPQYTAIARFIVTPSNALVNRTDVVNSLATLNSQSVMATYAEVMNSNRVYSDALAFLQLQPKDVKNYTYKASVASSSSVLELSVTGPDPQMAAKLANTIGYQTISFSNSLNQVFSVAFLDIAAPPVVPSSPQPLLNSVMAIVLGLVVGAILAILIEQLRMPLEVFRQRLHIDNMTGVYNSRYFSRLVEDELEKNPKEVLSIGIVELTGLRDLIDTFPIASLQKVFQKITTTLRKELRGNDIIGRWNDVSFVVMLPSTPAAAASRIFERISQALSDPVDLDQFDVNVTLDSHIGGAEYGNEISSRELFEMSDKALDQARRDNDSRVCVWNIKSPFWADKNPNQE